jgi:hypothetical protein
MSILIKGMEMPDCCKKCPFLDYECGYCFARGKKQKDGWYDCDLYVGDNEKRDENCPLVPVPPHGDWIDRDDFFATCPELVDGYKRITDDLVVIPAEEGER